ncbi:hypothetical protein N8616_05620, partial [Verrucomicrobia bacterium]|nr:hypothetical protein [Verrucomicrobiota bacterium]
MKQIIAVLGLVILLQGCSTASVDRNKADTNKKNDTLQPSEKKLTSAVKLSQGQKAARKPYNFVIVDYMNVVEGQEDNYLKAEAVWLKVHQDLAEQGRILGWGLAKARENKLGIEFITWKIVHS